MGQRILVVDDDELTRDVLATILDLEEFSAVFADDGETALARLDDSGPFDAVVADVMMPGLDGFELCRRVKQSDQPELAGTPVILLTAKSAERDQREGEEAGADAYITKPFSPLYLVESIRELDGAGS